MILRTLLAAALALGFTAAHAQQINFNHLHVSAVEIDEIEQALNISGDTEAIDGVALAPSGDIYIIHRNDSLKAETFLRLDPAHPDEATVLKTDAQIATDLGTPFSATMILEGGFATDPARQILYFAESFNGEMALLAIDLTQPGNPARVVLRSDAQLSGMTDFAVLPSGNIVIVRGEDAGIGILNPNATTPTWQEVFTLAQIATILGTPGDPETVGVHPITGEVYVFCHTADELLYIPNIEAASPTATVVTPAAWGPVDLHDIVVDQLGNIYGFDEANERIVIWDGTNAYSLDLDELFEQAEDGHDHSSHSAPGGFAPLHGDGGGVTLWRGMAVTQTSFSEVRLYLAITQNDEFALLKLDFGDHPHHHFDEFEVIPVEIDEIEQALSISGDTEAIDGVALAPSGDIYIIHRNDSLKAETFLRLDPAHPDEATVLKTDAQIATDLGTPFSATMILEGGFATDPARQILYFAESFNGEMALLAIDLTQPGNPARVVLRSDAQLSGMTDFAVLPSGNIVIVRGEDAGIGILNPNATTPTWQEKVTRVQIATLTGGPGNPETVTAHPLTGDVYVFCHVVDELLHIRDIEGAAPQTTVITPAAWGSVDLHDMVMDEDGTLYGFDEANERIVILTASGQTYSHSIEGILEAAEEGHDHSSHSAPGGFAPLHGDDGGVTLWRGMAATKIDNETAVLYLALTENDEFGVLQVIFEAHHASVGSWKSYE